MLQSGCWCVHQQGWCAAHSCGQRGSVTCRARCGRCGGGGQSSYHLVGCLTSPRQPLHLDTGFSYGSCTFVKCFVLHTQMQKERIKLLFRKLEKSCFLNNQEETRKFNFIVHIYNLNISFMEGPNGGFIGPWIRTSLYKKKIDQDLSFLYS